MIKKLTGQLVEKFENSLVIDVNGIGFEVFVGNIHAFEIGKTYTFYIYEDRKETEVNLFGFQTIEELNMFSLIVGKIKGVGPKTAINIFRYLSVSEIKNSIQSGDYTPLLKVKGLGEKTAKRIVLEAGGELKKIEQPLDDKLKTALDSLTALGFDKDKAKSVLETLDKTKDEEEIIKEAIKKLTNA